MALHAALLQKGLGLAEQGQYAEALAVLEECLRTEPGWPNARAVRAGLLLEVGRPLEAREEVDHLLTMQPNEETEKFLLSLKQNCTAALEGPREPAGAAPLPIPLSRNAVRITCAGTAGAAEIARAWVRCLHAALSTRFGQRFEVSARKLDDAQGQVHWIDLVRGSRLQGRARVVWDPARPEEIILEATAEGIPVSKTTIAKMLDGVGALGALAAFVLWAWFVVYDWSRVWARLLPFSGPAHDRASKLEVFWFLLGWILGPGFSFFGFMMAGDWVNEKARLIRVRRVESFARRELDPALAEAVQRVQEQSARDPKLRAELGIP